MDARQVKMNFAVMRKGEAMFDIKEYLKQTKTVLVAQDAFDELIKEASAQPDIIRCKDCIFYDYDMGECDHKFGLMVANENSFCSLAERRILC